MTGPTVNQLRRLVTLGLMSGCLWQPPPLKAQRSDLRLEGCALCHGSLEFLRQHSPDLATARRRVVTMEEIRTSAHGDSDCFSCHQGFDRWPHRAESVSLACGSCHEEADAGWHDGVHGTPDQPAAEPVECAQCHSAHRTAPLDSLRAGTAMRAMNDVCVDCHETSGLPDGDPHKDKVGCASCHGPHETHDVDEVHATVAPLNQARSCGTCHEEEARRAQSDAHGHALSEQRPLGLATLELLGGEAPPTCTTCHGSHGMSTTEGPERMAQPNVCGECHEHALETFDDSYHGQATALGSIAVATCSDCHGSHGIYAEEDPRSMIHEDNLVESCGACHPSSRAAFVLYQPHADHNDRENYPVVYWSYRLMTALLVGVFSVFGLHSALWILRLTLDTLRTSKGGTA